MKDRNASEGAIWAFSRSVCTVPGVRGVELVWEPLVLHACTMTACFASFCLQLLVAKTIRWLQRRRPFVPSSDWGWLLLPLVLVAVQRLLHVRIESS